jgi:cytochrome c peroxidase
MKIAGTIVTFITIIVLASCKENDDVISGYSATPAPLEIPAIFQNQILDPTIPEDNPQTVEGIALGKKLFFDQRLSADNTVSCASCHLPQKAFTDPRRFSSGITGIPGFRNSMPLHNLAWNYGAEFNWDGSANSLENQIFEPVINPIEMANSWDQVEMTLAGTGNYPDLFEAAFETRTIDSTLVTKAIAQFIRTMVSANSKFDRAQLGLATLTPQEENGLNVFLDESRGDCFHCHGLPAAPLWTDNAFHNNGLDAIFTDRGLGEVTGDPRDFGKFKTPSLRNLAYSAPYMHDGRFNTLDEVINHYSGGLVYSETIDPLMKTIAQGGVQLTQTEKDDLKAFLLSLSDPSFVVNPDFENPN